MTYQETQHPETRTQVSHQHSTDIFSSNIKTHQKLYAKKKKKKKLHYSNDQSYWFI